MRSLRNFAAALLVLGAWSLEFYHVPVAAASSESSSLVFIGTYTGRKSQGIYVSKFDSSSGKLSPPQLAAEMRNPSFLAIHPNGQWLYAVGEVSDFGAGQAGAVSAFQIDRETGHLALLNAQPSAGAGPCHLAVDRTGKCVLVANYSSGSVASFPLRPDGGLSAHAAFLQHHGSSMNPQRQEGPHAHFITPDPANRFALACDLGLDKVFVYQLIAAKGLLAANDPPSTSLKPGSGPRHLIFHPTGAFVYVINELGSSLTAFSYDHRDGRLSELQTVSTLPPEFKGDNTCAEVQIHPSGRFVYASNRGHNSIAAFAIDPGSGKLTYLGCQASGGKTPRHFALDSSGKWMLAENQDSDSIVAFHVDGANGHLLPTRERIEVGSPVCVVFLR